MRILALATALLALVLPLASPASANQNGSCPQVIDDFSQGALPPNNGPHDFTHVGLPPQSCLLGSRRVVVVGPERTGGMVNLGGGNIAFQATSTTPSGGQSVFDPNILLEYTTATPVDITAGGLNDRIILDIAQWDEMSVFVYFEYLGGGTGKHLFPSSAGQLEILLSEFTFADFTQIKAIRFNFFEQSFNGESSMTVSRIRTEGSNLNILQFEVPELIEIGPPFPFPGPLMETFFVDDAGQLQQSISIFTTFQTAHVLPIGPFGPTLFPVQLASSDSGPGRARGFSAGFEMVEAAAGKADHRDGYFEWEVEFDTTGGDLFPMYVEFPQEPSITPDAVYIDFIVEMGDPTGLPVGTNALRCKLEIPDGAGYDFNQAFVEQTHTLGFMIGFELRDDGSIGKADKTPGHPLFNLTFEGDFVQPDISTPAPLLAPETLVLGAAPSVTSDRTTLRLSGALDQDAALTVYDLAGRMVRTLHLPAGRQSLAWDTRDARGRAVASGVYVVRLETAAQAATRKVTVMR